MFRARASLSHATLLIILGLLGMGVGIFMMSKSLMLFFDLRGAMSAALAVAGAIVVIGVGAGSLAAGMRSIEMFERKLLMTISSRGRVIE